MLANIFERLEINGNQLIKYDYYDILYITNLHEYYLPIQLWQNIAFQLDLPCVNDNIFINNKYIERKNLMMKQVNNVFDKFRIIFEKMDKIYATIKWIW